MARIPVMASTLSEEPLEEPRSISGKRPTDASLQRQRDYFDWLPTFDPHGDADTDSWSEFMAERRRLKEKARLQKIAEQRKRDRQQQPDRLPTAPSTFSSSLSSSADMLSACASASRQNTHRSSSTLSSSSSSGRIPVMASTFSQEPLEEPRTISGKRPTDASLQRQRDYFDWLPTFDPHGDADTETWSEFMAERRTLEEKSRLQNQQTVQARKRGRPIDPYSCRQLELARELVQAAEDPAVRAERLALAKHAQHEREEARWVAELAKARAWRERNEVRWAADPTAICEWWRSSSELGCNQLLASMPNERRAEARRLFWESARLRDVHEIASIRRHRLKHRNDVAAKLKNDAMVARKAYREAEYALLQYLRGRLSTSGWTTEGQCEGTTRLGERCKVHRSSPYAVAASLRRGERFCGHHHPDKYTGVRCAGIRKHGKGQCKVWSGSCYADAAPLRRGSPFCHHHRVRCAGLTKFRVCCSVTSSCEHAHADPLRNGNSYCAHHFPAPKGPHDSNGVEASDCEDGSDEGYPEEDECDTCGQLSACCECQDP